MSKTTTKDLPWTGERYVPQIRGDIALEHLHRYAFASGLSEGKRVLDIACGEGYGSEMLSHNAKSVVGVDIDPATVAHAIKKYRSPKMKFIKGACEKIPLPDKSVDLVVSFETLEHIEDHDQFLGEIERVLDSGGILVISTPEKSAYSDKPEHVNPFHKKELYREQFLRLLSQKYRHMIYFEQKVAFGSCLVAPKDQTMGFSSFQLNEGSIANSKRNGLKDAVYLVAVCSKAPLPELAGSMYEDRIWKRQLEEDLNNTNLVDLEIFYSSKKGDFSEKRKITHTIKKDGRIREKIVLPTKSSAEQMTCWRLDPGHQAAKISLLGMKFLDKEGRVLWELQDNREQIVVSGTSVELPLPKVGLELLSTGGDPFILLPPLPPSALPISSIHVDIEISSVGKGIDALVRMERGKITRLQQALAEKDTEATQLKTILMEKDQELRKAAKIDALVRIEKEKNKRLQQVLAEKDTEAIQLKTILMERDQQLRKAAEIDAKMEQIRQEIVAARGETKTVYKRFDEKQIAADSLQTLISEKYEQLSQEQKMNEGKIRDLGDYASEVQKALASPLATLIPAPFSWYGFLYSMLKIKGPKWLEDRKTLHSSKNRPGFWRRLERSIRKRRKRWISGVGFKRDWYLKEYPDVARAGIDPLNHYIQFGIHEGRWKSKRHKEGNKKFLQKTISWSFDRIGFDSSWYLKQYSDVAEAGVDAFWHYKNQGIKEGRFKNRKEQKKQLSWGAKQISGSSRDLNSEDNSRAEVFIPYDSLHGSGTVQTDIRAIALYLPQFHAIPENDGWWGKGFTEWTNVRRGKPHYEGHNQPHVPHQDLGYYDLNDPSVMEKQATMAKAAGIEGFCFYYYWFNGKRLLNMPTDRMLASGKPDLPFCFCWANENWTRTWDGGDNEILMAQKHCAEDDERFIYDLLPAFRDKRYIRVTGKPLLVVYRPSLLPNARRTTDRWREICRKEGIGEIHLAFMLGFEDLEPASIGFDTAIQMPPLRSPLPNLKKEIKTNNSEKFVGEIRDYRGLRKGFDLNQMDASTWPAVCPSWDNTARKMERAHSWIHSCPENYLTWLQEVVTFLRKNRPAGERILFINAWNEWAEGCHLEPDEKYGYAWLNATRCALTDTKPPVIPACLRVLVAGHDACRNGAQILLLTLLREWKKRDDVEFRLILLCDGVLRNDFQKTAPMIVLTDYPTEDLRKEALDEFCGFGPNVILSNTAVSGPILPTLKSLGVPIVSYIHELQKSIARWAPGPIMAATVSNSDHFIAVSKPVEENLIRNHGVRSAIISCQNPCIKTSHPLHLDRLENFRSELGVQRNEKIVFGCGTPDWRKGADIFVQVAENVIQQFRKVHFIWIGPERSEAGLKAFPQNPRIRFTGEREFPRDILPLGDVFFLPSREDPFPLVALEAADAGLPIVCFADAGGIPEFVGNNCGRCVPLENVIEAGNAIVEILKNDVLRKSLGNEARNSVRIKHDAVQGSGQVLSILKQVYCDKVSDNEQALGKVPNPLVSVIVPNYNHARFLPERISSITNQTYRNIEVIVLDDKSTDGSMEVIRKLTSIDGRTRYIENEANSGSSFKQWRKGLREAKGKYVWIAESDDSAGPELLQTLVARLEANDKAVLAACCPRMTSLEGSDLGIPTDWFADIGGKQWENDFSSNGQKVVAEILSKKNAILNASGVVFRNSPELVELVDEDMKLCGDWLFWVRLLVKGDFEYVARPLNYWRIGSSNARTKAPGEIEWQEGKKVIRVVAEILGTTDTERSELLGTFKKRCVSWGALSKP
jgi:glycosyltransferase involved in cell wall biosynthesis/SAM-dependent methyltransferase